MGKKKRKRKTTVFGAIEGQEEALLLEYLKEVYRDDSIVVKTNPPKGGSPEKVLAYALKSNDRDRVFAWFDEDKDLSQDARKGLIKPWCLKENEKSEILTYPLNSLQKKFNQGLRKPILIVSQPVCVEGLILKILGKRIKHDKFDENIRTKQIDDLKASLGGIFESKNPIEYYRKNLNQSILEKRRKEIYELNLLINMISKK
jgi:hypothetical protein